METFIRFIFLILLIPEFLFAANSATADTVVPVSCGKGLTTNVLPIYIVYDTTSADLIVRSPATDAHVAVVGIQYVEADAHNITFKTQSTTMAVFQMPENSGLSHTVCDGVMFITGEGEDLIINSDAALTSFVIYVQEFKELYFDNR